MLESPGVGAAGDGAESAAAPDDVRPPSGPSGPAPPRRSLRRPAGVSGLVLGAIVLATLGTGYTDAPAVMVAAAVPGEPAPGDAEIRRVTTRVRRLERRLAALAPRGIYIVIDQSQNRLYLLRDATVLHRATCSAGSGLILKEGGGGRTWVFDTPRGQFTVLSKRRNPVWRKPDWAFVEEGKPIPDDPADRLEYGSLGEYALYFGNGFLIHGTLYERLLGRSVSHGCIRLGREDLRTVYSRAPVGTPIFIY